MELLNKDLRRRIIKKAYEEGLGHNGSALSCVDAIAYLYREVMKEKDTFILSKGHGAMALYVVLESLGKEVKWEMHPKYNEREGISATTGSLGHGLPIGLGRAYAKKIKGEGGRVYVLTGDGEMEEGSIWESLILADRLDVNLNVLVDWNKYQVAGSVDEIARISQKSLEKKLIAFGCKNVSTIDGHDDSDLFRIRALGWGLNAVILDTVKGKGVKMLEETHSHGFDWRKNPDAYRKALEELE